MNKKKKTKNTRGQQGRERPSGNAQILSQRGEELFREGKYAEAAEAWKTALRRAPQPGLSRKQAEASFRSGLLYLRKGDLKRAISDLSQAACSNEEVSLYPYHLALARHRQGNLPKAVVSYQKALERDKANRRYLYHYGLALMDQGEPEKAVSFFLERARREPKEARWKWGLANLYLHLSRREELTRLLESPDAARLQGDSLRVFQGVFHLVNGNPKQAVGHLEAALQGGKQQAGAVRYALGAAHLKAGNLERALDSWETALQEGYLPVREPLSLLYHLMGDRSWLAGNEEAARTVWEKTLRIDPGNARVAERLAYLQWAEGNRLAAEGKPAEAFQAWGEAIRLRPGEARLAHNLALLAEERKDHEEAVRMWELVIRSQPRDVNKLGGLEQRDRLILAHRHLSRNCLELGLWDKALEGLKAALRLNPQDPSLLLETGNLCLEGGEEKQALTHLKRAHALQPENPAILNGLGAIYEARGEETVAQEYWEQTLQIDPDNGPARERLSQLYAGWTGDRLREGKPREAIELCEKALQLFPRDHRILLDMGRIYLELREWKTAEETFRRAIEANPENAFILVEVGHRYLHVPRKKKEAENYFQAALRLSPQSAKVCQEIGNACLGARDSKRALRYFERALELAPQDPQLPLEIGQRLLDGQQKKLALPYLERAVKLKPDDPYPRYLLGCAYRSLHRPREARAAWNEALRTAREQGNLQLAQEIEWSRSGAPPMLAKLFSLFGMEMLDEAGENLEEDDFFKLDEGEDDEEDEEEWF